MNDYAFLSNGVKMPWLGFGLYKVDPTTTEDNVSIALEAGYRSIDTAAFYQNEEGVAKALRDSGINREEVFITTKVWNDQQGYKSTLEAFSKSCEKLDVDYVDLYLIHWPVKDKFKDTWKAFEELYSLKKVRAIGVSNFHIHHIEALMEDASIKPMVNQVELHPYLTQVELLDYCRKYGIQLEAWSPLMRGKVLEDPVITKLAKKYNKTPAQIVLRWDIQQDIITIPKSIHKNRIIENIQIFDFNLTNEDMELISNLNKNIRVGSNPDSFNF